MAYTVLARRYRSQSFDDVVGQDAVAQTLKNAIDSGRVAHAYLFSGTRGVGKTTMARILAKALNCLKADGPTTTPCCKCDSCVSVNNGDDIDVIEIDGASNTGVDNIRELRQNAIYRPARARFKIYIIDEVHMLSTGAFNALLKILEEPPDHVKFIFATTEPHKVLATIQSRCQCFDFSSISPPDIAKQFKMILKKEKVKFEDDLIIALARLANGSMRDGLSLLDQLISTGADVLTTKLLEEFIGEPNRGKMCDLAECIGDSDTGGTLEKVDELLSAGLTSSQIVDAMINLMRDLMVMISTSKDSDILILTNDEKKRMGVSAEKFDVPGLIYNITTLEKLRWTIKNSDNPRALLEASMLRLGLSEHFLDVRSVMAQLKSGKVTSAPAVKKNLSTRVAVPSSEPKPAVVAGSTDWQSMVTAAKIEDDYLGGLLGKAVSAKFDNDNLTLVFTDGMTKGLCESEARAKRITELLSSVTGKQLMVKYQLDETEQKNEKDAPQKKEMPPSDRQKVLDDPAVQLLQKGLDAQIIDVKEE